MSRHCSLLTKIIGAIALILIAAAIVIATQPAATVNAAITGMKGSGTNGDPYRIENAEDLRTLSTNVKNGNTFENLLIILVNDVDMSSISSWEPIGTESTPFKGTFDGNGRSITGLNLSDKSKNYVGLFGRNSGEVTNLSLSGTVKGNDNVGAIAARNTNTGRITSCTFSGTVNGSSYVGGIAGYNEGTIDNCFNDAAVNFTEKGGGIAGGSNNAITNCTNTGVIKGSKYAGGIAGINEGSIGHITNCLNEKYANVTAESGGDSYAGGIAGESNGDIWYCTNKAAVTSKGQCAGGMTGYGDKLTILECVNEGDVDSNGSERTGGIIGALTAASNDPKSITNCTNRGTVSGGSKTGGITGSTQYCSIENCISNGNVTGGSRTGGIAGELLRGAGIDKCTSTGKITGKERVGGIAGTQDHSEDVLNSINRGDVKGSGNQVGGITGYAVFNYTGGVGSARVRYCTNHGDVSGKSNTGGIAGFSNANISNNINKGDVSGTTYTGGIVGLTYDGGDTLQININEGDVSGTEKVGGICGYQRSSAIVSCYNKGDVTGNQDVGGIVGFNEPVDVGCTIKYCINSGDVRGKGSSDEDTTVGGIVGYGNQVSVIECGNTGDIEADGRHAGGIIGYAKGASITDSYNRGAVYAYREAGGILGDSRSEVKITRCYCFAPDDHPKHSGKDGVDCEYYDPVYWAYAGGLVGRQSNNDSVLKLKDNYWWSDCSDYALGWVHEFGILSGDGYDYFYYQKRFKDPSYFKGWDFNNTWVVKGDAPVNRRAQNINPKGGVGGIGGIGGTGAVRQSVSTRLYIKDLAEMKQFRDNVNNGNSYAGISVYLQSDLDLSGSLWTPVGNADNPFWGYFYGENHVIKGMNVDTSEYGGLFGYCGGSIYDLWVCGSVKSSGYNAGGIAGFSSGSIKNCTFIGDVTSTAEEGNAGGIAGGYGMISNFGLMTDCLHVGKVSASGGSVAVGGIAGSKIVINFEVANCIHIGSVTGNSTKVGALFGTGNQMGKISRCIAAEGSCDNLFGKYTANGGDPVQCAFFTAEQLIDPASFENMYSSSWSISFEAGYTWGVGWEYPIQQQFANYITLVPANDKDDTRVVWLPRTEMKLPSAAYTRKGYSLNSWNTERDGSGTRYVAGDTVPANAVLYGQWDLVDYTITFTDTGNTIHYNIESTKTLPSRYRDHYSFDGWKVVGYGGNWGYNEVVAGGELLTGRYGNVRLSDQWSELQRFTVTWKMDDGSVIDRTNVEDGKVPSHAVPVKEPTAEFNYEFTGWTPELTAVQNDTEYTATFREVRRSYTITWKNDDGSVIDTTTVEYGTVPAHADASKDNTAEYTYTFAGWTPVPVAVTGDATYTASFTSAKNSYTITWKNDDGTVIDTTTVEYGTVPAHADAAKDNTAEYTYTFAGWSPAPAAVTGKAEYTATFSSVKNSYEITWKNDDGTVIDITTVEYGTVPTHADATKDNTAEYTYTFAGWSPEPAAVTGNAEYTAVFTDSVNTYVVTWKNDDGTVIDTTTVEYGTVPTHDAPVKENTAEFTYEFIGWKPEVVAVTGEAVYTAEFRAVRNAYTISWLDEDGSLIEASTLEYGDIPAHDDMVRSGDSYNTYEFIGWEPEIGSVTGDASYKAVYKATPNSYEIKDGDKLTWTKGSGENVTLTAIQTGAEDRSFEDFTGIEIDGSAFAKDGNYNVARGSTVVTLLANMLESLDKGEHTVTVKFIGGEATVKLEVIEETIVPIPTTGEGSDPFVIILCVTCAAALALVIARKQKKRAAER
jgi:hypothetical protein